MEVIGYGGEEYSTDEEYSSDEENGSEFVDSGDDEELKRLTEANTNLNSKSEIVSEKVTVKSGNVAKPATVAVTAVTNIKSPVKKPMVQNKSPPLVTIQPFSGEQPKSLVFNFLKNKEIAMATTATTTTAAPTATCEEVQKIEKKDTENIQLRKTETTKKPTLSRSSLVANSNEPYLNIRRCSLPAEEEEEKPTLSPPPPTLTLTNTEIPRAKLIHQLETIAPVEKSRSAEKTTEVISSTRELDSDTVGGGAVPYKTRSNVPRIGTMHFKLKLAVASSQKPEPLKLIGSGTPVDPPPDSSLLTSREMAGEPDGKADSDEPGDPTITPLNRSFLHNFKDNASPLRDTSTTPPRTPIKKVS